MLDVYSGEVLRWDVAVAGTRIAAVGPDLRALAGPDTVRLAADGRILVPGFVDGHTHQDHLASLPEFLRAAIPRGLTTLVTEVTQVAAALGVPGVRWFLTLAAAQPIHVFATVPVIPYLSTDDGTGRPVIPEAALEALLEEPAILGLGEVYWHRLLADPKRLLPLLDRALRAGKTVEGHGAGARGAKLAAFVAAGAGSCHEPITAAEALERLRLGLHVFVREGSVRRDLAAVLPVHRTGVELRRLVLCSDGIWPPDLLRHGYLDTAIERAIALGVPPAAAFQMASLNAAEHFRLDGELGGIAPGRSADFLVLPDLRTVRPEVVVARGRVVAREGTCVAPLPRIPPPSHLTDVLRLGGLGPEHFALRAAGSRVRVRVIRFVGDIVTAEDEAELPVRDGVVAADPGAGCLLAVALDRRGSSRRGLGVVRGFGLREGALASTVSFDTADVVGVGASPEVLAAAVARLQALRGGIVAVDGRGAVRAEVPLAVGGVLSLAPYGEVAAGLEAVEAAARALGATCPRPLLSLQTLTFAAIPSLRLTSHGLLHVKSQQWLPVLL